jgi:hypothetical protein
MSGKPGVAARGGANVQCALPSDTLTPHTAVRPGQSANGPPEATSAVKAGECCGDSVALAVRAGPPGRADSEEERSRAGRPEPTAGAVATALERIRPRRRTRVQLENVPQQTQRGCDNPLDGAPCGRMLGCPPQAWTRSSAADPAVFSTPSARPRARREGSTPDPRSGQYADHTPSARRTTASHLGLTAVPARLEHGVPRRAARVRGHGVGPS